MTDDIETWKLRTQAFIAGRILKKYRFFRDQNFSVEIEDYVSKWLKMNTSSYNQDFHDGVLREVLNLMRRINVDD